MTKERKLNMILLLLMIAATVQGQELIKEGRFQEQAFTSWKIVKGQATFSPAPAGVEGYALCLASNTLVSQTVTLAPHSAYRLTARVRCGSGAEEVLVQVSRGRSILKNIASPSVDWKRVSIDIETGEKEEAYAIELTKPYSQSGACGWICDVSLVRTGNAAAMARRNIPQRMVRHPALDQGIVQQSNDALEWLLDAKLGLFIHWGLYAGLAKGEWGMQNYAIPIEDYRKLAYPASGDEYFAADSFNADEWAALARDAGMKYMYLVTQHHDGYALFHSRYPDVFSSYQTHNRDFVKEYVEACRKAGLKVGLYKTLINWRYPAYYDVTGENCMPNKWGYTTAAWHRENACEMKNEIYCLTKELLSHYGKIDLLFWDGGWLAERGSDADASYFWEPGLYLDSHNRWPVKPEYTLTDSLTGRPLGLMGMVRRLQPSLLCNIRSGWMGDYENEEGGATITGPVRNSSLVEKCMSLHGAWGYTPAAEQSDRITSLPALQRMLADCLMRNMVLSLNVGPDRHGRVTKAEADVLRSLGGWVQEIAEAVYGTRGGPWDPQDGEFGFSYKDDIIYVYLLKDYKGGDSFLFPALDRHKVKRVYRVEDKKRLSCKKTKSGEYEITGIERGSKEVSVIAVQLNKKVYE